MAISLADKIADFKEQYLVSETELYSSNPQRELELTVLLGRLGYRNELDLGNMMRSPLHVPASYRIWKEGRAEVFSRENLFQNVGIDTRFPQFTYLSFSNQAEFEKFDKGYERLVYLEEESEYGGETLKTCSFIPPLIFGLTLSGVGAALYLGESSRYSVPAAIGLMFLGTLRVLTIPSNSYFKNSKKKQVEHGAELKQEQDGLKKELVALPLEKYFGREALEKVLSCSCQVD